MNNGAGPAAERNFILQQGFHDPSPQSCLSEYSALVFQPRIVGLIVLLGIVLQSPPAFLILSAILWWSALLPRWNPFDALHNVTLGGRSGATRLAPAPAPRRFSQGMAGTFALAIGMLLILEWKTAAVVMEILLLIAVAALAFGKFCLGSFVFHLIRGRAAFARSTLPWSRR